MNNGIAIRPALAKRAVRHATDFCAVGIIRDIQRRRGGWAQFLVFTISARIQQGLVKVHAGDAFIDLYHPFLQSRSDPQFIVLDRKDHTRQKRLVDGNLIELQQRPHGRRDDRARPGHPHQSRHIALICDPEFLIWELNALRNKVIVKLLHRRQDQPHAAVISVEFLIREKVIHALKDHQVIFTGHDFKPIRFAQRHGRAVVADDERDRLAEISVRRIPDKSGPGVCVCGDCGCHESRERSLPAKFIE